jgi:hypothetical protein
MVQEAWLMSLPVPSRDQTAKFADHVADNHSWYKHLPFFPPGAWFVLFPNPHAGRRVEMEGDRLAVFDVEQGDYFAHHSRLATAEYRAQFGHWDYWVVDNPRVPDPQPGPWLCSADSSQREFLTDNLKRQWSCRLTAFLKPAPPMFNLRSSELKGEADAFMASGRRRLGRFLLGLFGRRWLEKVDPAFVRYRAVAQELRQAAGTFANKTLYPFMESEARAQRELLMGTLHRIRRAWLSSQEGRT